MGDDDAGRSSAETGKLLAVVVLVAVVAVFALANTQRTTVDFVFAETRAPLIVVLLATALVGAVIGALVRFERRH